MERPCPDKSKKVIHLYLGLMERNRYFIPIPRCGVKRTPYINSACAGMERSCLRDAKNLSFVDMGLNFIVRISNRPDA